jgi:hypothetical protein
LRASTDDREGERREHRGMRCRVITAATAAICSLALGGPAVPAASAMTAPSAATQAAVDVATATWGPACGGRHVTIRWGSTGDSAVLGWAAWTDGTGRYLGDAGTPDERTDCLVMVSIDDARSYRSSGWADWDRYCTLIVHEYGHLTGHDHVADSSDVMAPVQGTPFGPCVTAARRHDFTSQPFYTWVRGRQLARRMASH